MIHSEEQEFLLRDQRKQRVNTLRETSAKELLRSLPEFSVDAVCRNSRGRWGDTTYKVPFYILTPGFVVTEMGSDDLTAYAEFLRALSSQFPDLLHNEKAYKIIRTIETAIDNAEANINIHEYYSDILLFDPSGDVSRLLELTDYLSEEDKIFMEFTEIRRGDTVLYVNYDDIVSHVAMNAFSESTGSSVPDVFGRDKITNIGFINYY